MDSETKERYFLALTLELDKRTKRASKEVKFEDVAALFEEVNFDWSELESKLNFDKF